MNPLQSGISSQYYGGSIDSAQPLDAAGPHASPRHLQTLTLAGMSRNTLDALEQANKWKVTLAMHAIKRIDTGALSLISPQGADAHYATANKDLTVHARLNEQSRYDIISISSPGANTIYLTVPPPSADVHRQTFSVSSHPAEQHSRDRSMQVRIMQNHLEYHSGVPLPSGASVNTQSMGFSHDGSAGASKDVAGPGQTRIAHAAHASPYAVLPQPDSTSLVLRGSNSTRVNDPDKPGKTISLAGLRDRQMVIDPETGQEMSRSMLRGRQKIKDPETGEEVSRTTLQNRRKTMDPTGKMVSRSTLYKQQMVTDPGTGETISKGEMYQRKQVRDPKTGDEISRRALYFRQIVKDPVTGEEISRSALYGRQHRRAKARNA